MPIEDISLSWLVMCAYKQLISAIQKQNRKGFVGIIRHNFDPALRVTDRLIVHYIQVCFCPLPSNIQVLIHVIRAYKSALVPVGRI